MVSVNRQMLSARATRADGMKSILPFQFLIFALTCPAVTGSAVIGSAVIGSALVGLSAISAVDARAELLPGQVAVVANDTSAESMLVAKHYMERRGVPAENLLALHLPKDETISRDDYEKSLVIPLRLALQKKQLSTKIRVLVTTFDVPLRVSAPEAMGPEKQSSLDALSKRQSARLALSDAAVDASRILSDKPLDKPKPETSDEDLVQIVDREFKAAAGRIKALPDPTEQKKANDFLAALLQKVNGAAGIASTLKPQAGAVGPEAQKLNAFVAELSRQVAVAGELLKALDALPSAENRERGYAITSNAFGALGVLQRANNEVAMFRYEAADASVDNELSLLWWDRTLFPIQGRLPNPYFLENRAQPQGLPPLPVLMVSRLDGPTSAIASGLVDLALTAEAEGLKGDVFVDARGMKATDRDTFFKYDQDLRDFGWLVRNNTDYDVSIENHEELLEKAENAALYVGWYAVHAFSGKFTFAPGAIGYHIASSEALSVRNPKEPGWCKNLLERGITATLGAVDEPYLEAFPLPSEFFGLLMTGKYTLVEAYYMTARYISWRLALFGDPLYNPFKAAPQLSAENLKIGGKEISALPEAPSEAPAGDPVEIRQQLEIKRKETQSKIDEFFRSMKQNVPASPKAKPPRATS